MATGRWTARVAGVLAVGTLAGCATVSTTVMRNPMGLGGRVPANLVPVFDTDRAEHFGVAEQTFEQEATWLSADAHQVCFAVTLRTEGTTPALASIDGWRVSLHGSQGIESRQPVFGPPTPPTSQTMAGGVMRREYIGNTVCTRMNGCMPQYVMVRDPVILTVLTGGGSVCFDHGGRLTAGTDRVELELDDPTEGSRRFVFRWRLVP